MGIQTGSQVLFCGESDLSRRKNGADPARFRYGDQTGRNLSLLAVVVYMQLEILK